MSTNRKPLKWFKVAESEADLAFADNSITVVELKGKSICIGRYKENLFAFAYKCPHASGLLSEGYIDAIGNVVCPLHRYKYSLQNGRNTSGEGYYLKNWPVELRDSGVFVGMEDQGLFSFLS